MPLRLPLLLLPLLFLAVAGSPARAGDATTGTRPSSPTGAAAPADPAAPPSSLLAGPPRLLDPRLCGIGRRVADVGGQDLDGAWRTLAALLGPRATVVALASATSPSSARLAPALAQLEQEYAARGVAFLFVSADATDTPERCRALAAAHGLRGTFVLDLADEIVGGLGVQSTTEVFVLDAARTLVYRGAVTDQDGADAAPGTPRREHLRRALEAVLAGERPEVSATSAPGPAHEPRAAAVRALPPRPPTYHGRISRIVTESCLECHRAGGVGPFPLESYAQLAAKAKTIAEVVLARIMPPWLAAPPPPGAESPWANDRSLTDDDRAALLAWVAAGAPQGDPAEAPLARRFPEGWSIGVPDAVFGLPEAFAVRAEGVMPYIHVRVPTRFAEDRWVRAIEISPTARAVVHHVLVFAIPPADPGQPRGRPDETRGFFGAYVPGLAAITYPEGTAKRLRAGSDLLFQLHYTPNGKATHDRTQIALSFAKEPPRHIVRVTGLAQKGLKIPPGARGHEESASITAPADLRVLALLPHMHVRGMSFRFDAARPGGARAPLLDVPRWDFDWQLRYALREPLDLPKGTVISATGRFDNSAQNPANPDPTRQVKWGPQTTDEMLLGYLEYVLEKEDPAIPEEGAGRASRRVLR